MQNDHRPLSPVEKLGIGHDPGLFDCSDAELNRFLKRFALASQQAGSAQTYVVCRTNAIVGYYSLTVGSAAHQDAPDRITQGLARHPVPVMILARLAVYTGEQGRGLGKALLRDSLLRTIHAADIAGIRALFVHAKDDKAKAFYEHFDFVPSPVDPHHLFLLMKDLLDFLAVRLYQRVEGR